MLGKDLKDTCWFINKVPGDSLRNMDTLVLRRIGAKDKHGGYVYGTTITFSEDSTFKCNYSAPCGNDCFPSSRGTYQMIDEDHISIYVERYQRVGDCEEIKRLVQKNIGVYRITKEKDKLILSKE